MVILLEKETERLAVGVVYLLYKRVLIDFPTSNRAHPSHMIYIQKGVGDLLRPGDKVFLPFQVVWYIWESCVYPVIQDLWVRDLASIGNIDEQIAYVSGMLKKQLIAKGYWPSSESFNGNDFTLDLEEGLPGLYGNMKWLRLHFKLPEDTLPTT